MDRASCLVALVAVAAVACSPSEPSLGEEFSLKVGENVALREYGLWVSFLEVAADSRCPLRVQCVWAGDATVLVETAPLIGDSKTDTLHTNEGPKVLPLGPVQLELVRLDPYPDEPGSISAERYVARFVLTRAE